MSEPVDKPAHKPVVNEWVETITVVVEALLIAILLRSFLYQPFSIPTASMQQTLMIGDYFVANKFVWGYGKHSFSLGRYGDFTALDFELPISNRILGRDPNRGDIAVFRPVPQTVEYIKRIVGLPGDTIQMKQGRLYINDVMVEREETGTAQERPDSSGHGLSRNLPRGHHAHHSGNLRQWPARQYPALCRASRPLFYDGRQS
jgi:signal peptidase I